MRTSLVASAIHAARQGFHVFPCLPGGKVPAVKWSEEATTDLGRIAAWWAREPLYNPAVACKPSGLIVVDCDRPKTGRETAGTPYAHLAEQGRPVDGEDVLAEFCARAGADMAVDTYTVLTGSGGVHLYYRWPQGVPVSQASPLPLVDVRTAGGRFGGYVLAAGSVVAGHPRPYVAAVDADVRDAPPWLVELCREKPPKPRQPAPYGGGSLFRQPGAGGGTGGLVDTVRYAGEGNRNAALHWAACQARDDLLSQEEAEQLLIPAATEAGLRDDESRRTVRSAYSKPPVPRGAVTHQGRPIRDVQLPGH